MDKRIPIQITPPDRFYGEQVGHDLFERCRGWLESLLLDLAFVLDGLAALAESPREAGVRLLRLVADRRFLRLALVVGTVVFVLTR